MNDEACAWAKGGQPRADKQYNEQGTMHAGKGWERLHEAYIRRITTIASEIGSAKASSKPKRKIGRSRCPRDQGSLLLRRHRSKFDPGKSTGMQCVPSKQCA